MYSRNTSFSLSFIKYKTQTIKIQGEGKTKIQLEEKIEIQIQMQLKIPIHISRTRFAAHQITFSPSLKFPALIINLFIFPGQWSIQCNNKTSKNQFDWKVFRAYSGKSQDNILVYLCICICVCTYILYFTFMLHFVFTVRRNRACSARSQDLQYSPACKTTLMSTVWEIKKIEKIQFGHLYITLWT